MKKIKIIFILVFSFIVLSIFLFLSKSDNHKMKADTSKIIDVKLPQQIIFKHLVWEDTMIEKPSNQLCRKKGDCALILKKTDNLICVFWKGYQKGECFQKNNKNIYEFTYDIPDDVIDMLLQEKYEMQEYTFDHPFIVVDPYTKNPLSALMRFPTVDKAEITIRVHGIDESADIVHTFKGYQKNHKIPVLGLYPKQDNKITLLAHYENGTQEIRSHIIKTGYVKLNTSFIPMMKKDKKSFFYQLVGVDSYVFDENGYVRSAFKGNPSNGFIFYFKDGFFQDFRSNSSFTHYTHFGKKIREYQLPSGFETYNHGIYRGKNDSFLIVASYKGTRYKTVDGNERETFADHVIEIDKKTGALIKSFDLGQYVNPARQIVSKSPLREAEDWAHINSVVYANNKIFISAKHIGVFQIDYETKALDFVLTWPQNCDISGRDTLGGGFCQNILTPIQKNGYPFSPEVIKGTQIDEAFHYPMANHDFKVYSDGLFSVFSNNGWLVDKNLASKEKSDALFFQINLTEKTIMPQNKIELPIYAPIGSNVTLLPDKEEAIVFATQVADKNTGEALNYIYRFSLKDNRLLFKAVTTFSNSPNHFNYYYRGEPIDLYDGYLYQPQ